MKQTVLKIPEELLNFIGTYASKKGISMNALMLNVLDAYKKSYS